MHPALKKIGNELHFSNPAQVARAITLIENEVDGFEEFMQQLKPGKAPVIGITGPPGAGKSSLINELVKQLSSSGKQVAVVAVDPTSPFTRGSLLGDRIRMSSHFLSENVFIRSLATRGSLGGLSAKSIEVADILKSAAFDVVLVETVGVGQSEVEIAALADTVVVVLVPEGGDEVQFIKSGIMEIADVFAVNKSDRPGADIFTGNLRKLVSSHEKNGWFTPVVPVTAIKGEGIGSLWEKVMEHYSLSGNKKNVQILSEKAWQLISRGRMKNLDIQKLKLELEEASAKEHFNLYKFVEGKI